MIQVRDHCTPLAFHNVAIQVIGEALSDLLAIHINLVYSTGCGDQ